MDDLTIEQAAYILRHYHYLLNTTEKQESKAHQYAFSFGTPTTDETVLNQLKNNFEQFNLSCARRIITENPDLVFFNLCPICKKLARTPQAKQCRWCGHDWH